MFKSGEPVDELRMFLNDKDSLTDGDGPLCGIGRNSLFQVQLLFEAWHLNSQTRFMFRSNGLCAERTFSFWD